MRMAKRTEVRVTYLNTARQIDLRHKLDDLSQVIGGSASQIPHFVIQR